MCVCVYVYRMTLDTVVLRQYRCVYVCMCTGCTECSRTPRYRPPDLVYDVAAARRGHTVHCTAYVSK